MTDSKNGYISLHWFLPTQGDGRTLLQADAAGGPNVLSSNGQSGRREPTIEYLVQVAQAAEGAGFDAVLTPTGSAGDDPWITTTAVSQHVGQLRFIVALRPGSVAPQIAAQQSVAFQRHTGGRLMLNIVTGGSDVEQRKSGDSLGKDERYARTDEFLTILRGTWGEEPFDFRGEHLWVEGASTLAGAQPPEIYFVGASEAALKVAAKHADVYLVWGDRPPAVGEQVELVRGLAAAEGRSPRFGVRLHVIARSTSDEAWAAADALLDGVDDQRIAAAQKKLAEQSSVGQKRMAALHGGSRDDLEIYPNLWAGVGLLRSGAGTAIVGSYEEVADRIAEYHEFGVDEFILSGYPHDEEAAVFAEGVSPILRARGLIS